jgi:hypothetical protein
LLQSCARTEIQEVIFAFRTFRILLIFGGQAKVLVAAVAFTAADSTPVPQKSTGSASSIPPFSIVSLLLLAAFLHSSVNF